MDGESVSQNIEMFRAFFVPAFRVNSRYLRVEGSTLDCTSFFAIFERLKLLSGLCKQSWLLVSLFGCHWSVDIFNARSEPALFNDKILILFVIVY